MADIVIRLSGENTQVSDSIKVFNLTLRVELEGVWEQILEEAEHYEGVVYLYIQVRFTIPVIDTMGQAISISSGVAQQVRLLDVPLDRIVMLQAAYDGKYNQESELQSTAWATVWVYGGA